MNKELFSESQRFRQSWMWLLIITINGLVSYKLYKQILQQTLNINTIFPIGIMLLVTFLLISLRLDTLIKEDGIYVRFFPFHLKYKHYNWNNIKQLYVRKYNPISEYGGWGIRYGLFGKGMAYNVSGNMGLQIVFNNDKKLLIGTKKPEELKYTLNKLGQLQKELVKH